MEKKYHTNLTGGLPALTLTIEDILG